MRDLERNEVAFAALSSNQLHIRHHPGSHPVYSNHLHNQIQRSNQTRPHKEPKPKDQIPQCIPPPQQLGPTQRHKRQLTQLHHKKIASDFFEETEHD